MEPTDVVSIFSNLDRLGILELVGALAIFIFYPILLGWIKDTIAKRKKKELICQCSLSLSQLRGYRGDCGKSNSESK